MHKFDSLYAMCGKGWAFAKTTVQSFITTTLLWSYEIRVATVNTTVG